MYEDCSITRVAIAQIKQVELDGAGPTECQLGKSELQHSVIFPMRDGREHANREGYQNQGATPTQSLISTGWGGLSASTGSPYALHTAPAPLWQPMSTKRKAPGGGGADGNGSKRKVRFRGKDDSEGETDTPHPKKSCGLRRCCGVSVCSLVSSSKDLPRVLRGDFTARRKSSILPIDCRGSLLNIAQRGREAY